MQHPPSACCIWQLPASKVSIYSSLLVPDPVLLIVVWNGVMFVRQGLYQDGVFRFNVEFATNFPDSECPVNLPCENNKQ